MIERFMLNEELEERVCEITGVDYTGMLTVDDITNIIKDLIVEYDNEKEKAEDLQYDIDNNYTPNRIDLYEECGVSPRDFC